MKDTHIHPKVGNLKETREEEYQKEKNSPNQVDGYSSIQEFVDDKLDDITLEEAIEYGVTQEDDGTIWVPPWIFAWYVLSENYE